MFKQIFPLASIMFIRFFGMFIVLPVLSVYALSMEGATEMLVGLTFAGYSIAQMILVMPFGKLSDRIGRKVTIFIGLTIFAVGSLFCALSDNIYMLLFGRILQGSGAISAVTSALISDIVKEEQRTKAMAFVGIGIGLSTIISMILGPVIAAAYDLSMLFIITFVFVLIEMSVLLFFVPNPPKVHYAFHKKSSMKTLLKDGPIMTLSWVNLFQKALITATFVIVPVLFVKSFGWSKDELIEVYLPAFIIAFFAMGFSSMLADAKGKYKLVLIVSLVLFGVSYALIGLLHDETTLFIGVILFFIGFNMLEPMMQSLVTKYAKAHERGNVLGLFNGFGFLGSALGGLLGGWAIMQGYLDDATLVVIFLTLLLIFLGLRMHNPARLKNLYLAEGNISETRLMDLEKTGKIVEWYKNENEKLLIVKFDTHVIAEADIYGK